jgi:hypothetical protein
MASETRQLTLDAEEMVAALRAYRAANPKRIPAGEILVIRGEADGITIELKNRNDFSATETHKLSLETGREAVVRFCLENNIPLPLRGDKSMSCADGKFILDIRLESELLTGVNYTSESLARFKIPEENAAVRAVNARGPAQRPNPAATAPVKRAIDLNALRMSADEAAGARIIRSRSA